jgi:hypothetical protein
MTATYIHPRYVVVALICTPFLALSAYIAWIVVPIVVREVVPAVIRTLKII